MRHFITYKLMSKNFLIILGSICATAYILLYPATSHWFDYQYSTCQGITYPWYYKEWAFFIYWMNLVANKAIVFSKQTTIKEINNVSYTTQCTTDANIRSQLIWLIMQSDYSCIDTSEVMRLTNLLQKKEQIPHDNKTKQITEKETCSVVDLNDWELPKTGADIPTI